MRKLFKGLFELHWSAQKAAVRATYLIALGGLHLLGTHARLPVRTLGHV